MEAYAEMRARVVQLFRSEQFKEAAEILQGALERYPDHLEANAYNLALCYAAQGAPGKAIEALQYGLDRDVWYGVWVFEGPRWQAVRDLPAFAEVDQRNEAGRLAAQAHVQPVLNVKLPEGYTAERSWPLFVALHGGRENLATFQPAWTSDLLQREFVVVYLQSSQVASMDGFSWMDYDLALREVQDAVRSVAQDFVVDLDAVIAGGFSAGGRTTLAMAMDEQGLAMRGFVVLCPPCPDGWAEGVATVAAKRLRGALLTTEMDPRLGEQRKMVEALQNAGVPVQCVVTPNIGHWYPENLGILIDEAIDYIRAKNKTGQHA